MYLIQNEYLPDIYMTHCGIRCQGKNPISRHSGGACARLNPVAGVHNHLKRLDSGVRWNDSPRRFRTFYKTIKSGISISFGILNLGHWDLFGIWFLVLGIFIIFIK